MAALPKKKISKVRGKTRRAHNRASLTDLVKSTKYPGLSVPHRFRKYFDSLESTDKSLVRATGANRKSLLGQTVKPKAVKKTAAKPAKAVEQKPATAAKPESSAKRTPANKKKPTA